MPKRKKRKKRPAAQPKDRPGGWQPSYWMIVALVAIFFAGGVMLKAIFSPAPRISTSAPNYQPATGANSDLGGQVRLVAANFRCACGQCGELFLIDCTCDMSRGAKEEKDLFVESFSRG